MDNLQTSLYQTHLELGARLTPFGGWAMPVQYSGIISEVKAVRTAAGLFDVSHMGRLDISGGKAAAFLDRVLTGAASTLRTGRARYCLICNESGGVIDDTIFYRRDADRFLLIPNAGNRPAVVAWFQRWIAAEFAGGVDLRDDTAETALLALQGPQAAALLDSLGALTDGQPPSRIRPFAAAEGVLTAGAESVAVFIGRTGYTGEDGFELAMAAAAALGVFKALLAAGALPCGLGARDALRLEAGLPLHGHEIDPETTPIEAGLERFVRADGDYIGREALQRQREEGVTRRLAGLKLPGRSAPRAGYAIRQQGREVGRITSGSYSPTLDSSIAMGYLLPDCAVPGAVLEVDIRGRSLAAEVTPLPFYSRRRGGNPPTTQSAPEPEDWGNIDPISRRMIREAASTGGPQAAAEVATKMQQSGASLAASWQRPADNPNLVELLNSNASLQRVADHYRAGNTNEPEDWGNIDPISRRMIREAASTGGAQAAAEVATKMQQSGASLVASWQRPADNPNLVELFNSNANLQRVADHYRAMALLAGGGGDDDDQAPGGVALPGGPPKPIPGS